MEHLPEKNSEKGFCPVTIPAPCAAAAGTPEKFCSKKQMLRAHRFRGPYVPGRRSGTADGIGSYMLRIQGSREKSNPHPFPLYRSSLFTVPAVSPPVRPGKSAGISEKVRPAVKSGALPAAWW